MIRCEEILRELSDYIDEEITKDMRAQIEAHICACHRCEVLVNTTKMTLTLVSNDFLLELPKGVSERLMARLEQRTGEKREN